MRKSEFKKAFLVEWDRDRPAEAAVIAAEAAGVVWDPEEEPLPKLRAIHAGDCCCQNGFTAHLVPEGGPNQRWNSSKEQWRAYVEAARRSNAWEELRRLVETAAWPPSTVKSALLAILDGKEGE